MSHFSFTVERLNNLKCPSGKSKLRVYDAKVDGLTMRVNPGGSKVYWWLRRLPDDNESPRRNCEIRLGNFGDLTLDEARRKAEEFNVTVGNKKDPLLKSAGETLTYGALFTRYIEEYAKTRTATWQSSIYNHERYFKCWHNCALARITREKVQHWVNDTSKEFGKGTANRTYNTLRAVISWALRKDIISGANPCVGVDTFRLKARDRFILPGTEFAKFAKALNEEPNDSIRDFFWMCLFTGARRANVLAMEWSQIDFQLQVWCIPLTKNQESLTVPLTAAAMEILKRRRDDSKAHDQWVFPSDRTGKKTGVLGHLISPHKAWKRIIERAEIQDLRIHDLRRTAGSYMAIEGISSTIIGKALGHKSPASTAIYTRLTQDPVRHALEKAHEALIRPSTAKSVEVQEEPPGETEPPREQKKQSGKSIRTKALKPAPRPLKARAGKSTQNRSQR